MKNKKEIDLLKDKIHSQNWDEALKASDRLAEIGGDEVLAFLCDLLNSENSGIRNLAALALREMKDNRALEPLLKAITKKENENYRGTLVYALETLDCSQKLTEMFELLFYGNYEVKMGAANVLDNQEFEFTKDDLLEINEKWEDCKRNTEKCPAYEQTKEDIDNFVEGFMTYLK